MNLGIVIPMFNSASFVVRTIESVCAQRDSTTVVVVDDGSTDASASVASNFFAMQDGWNHRYQVLTTRRGGVSAARNLGLRSLDSDYVLFLDSDDLLAKSLSQIVCNYAEGICPDLITWGWSYGKNVWDHGRAHVFPAERPALMSGTEALSRRLDGSLKLWNSSLAFKRSFLLEHGLRFTEGCVSGEDMEFVYKCLGRAEDVMVIPQLLTHYVARVGSVSNSCNVRRLESVYALQRAFADLAGISTPQVRRLAAKWGPTKIIRNFDFTIRSLMATGAWDTQGELEDSIDLAFPGLLAEIIVTRRTPQGESS